MGYRGKLVERERARELRAQGMSLLAIAEELGVSKSSVSLWVRDMDVEVRRREVVARRPNRLHARRLAEIEAMNAEGARRLGVLSETAFLAAGAALYAGEGSKTDGQVLFANTNPDLVVFFLRWFRRFFEVDESRLRVRLYLHEGLDLDAAIGYWSLLTGIPPSQFHKPYRAVADGGIRYSKHQYGCAAVRYGSAATHRAVMGLVRALLTSSRTFRGGAIGSAGHC